MVHPEDTIFALCRLTSKVTGEAAQVIIDLYDANPIVTNKYGRIGVLMSTGDAYMIDCGCTKTWEEKKVIEPRLIELEFNTLPSYAPVDPYNMTRNQVDAIHSSLVSDDVRYISRSE